MHHNNQLNVEGLGGICIKAADKMIISSNYYTP